MHIIAHGMRVDTQQLDNMQALVGHHNSGVVWDTAVLRWAGGKGTGGTKEESWKTRIKGIFKKHTMSVNVKLPVAHL